MAAAGTLAAGTGVLTAALLVPAVASAPSSQTGTTGGVLKITAGCNQMSAGTLSSVITGTTPGTKFGQLSVGGKATLAGTLKVNTGNGFVPGHGQSFSVLLYHTRGGMFGTLSGTPAYTVNYTATAANVVYP
jgi:hypothetical protein